MDKLWLRYVMAYWYTHGLSTYDKHQKSKLQYLKYHATKSGKQNS